MEQRQDPAQGIGDSNGDILYSGLDPNSANPRQLVTLSMLYAYADMRGPPNASQPDPVMKSLYPTATQDGMARPLRFDPPGDEDIEGLPKGTKLYWEPPSTTFQQDAPPTVMAEVSRPRAKHVTYDEFTKQNPQTVGKNHYKGGDVYGNFGYVCVNGKWVDPDSQGELHKAYMESSAGPYAAAGLEDLQKLQALGPCIMSAEEREAFFEEMAENEDEEGDPRDSRIDAATFAHWATGAAPSNQYMEDDMSAQTKIADELYSDNTEQAIPPTTKLHLQFDEDTGGMLSGVYDLEKSPKPVKNPHGYLDMVSRPSTFTYMDPQAAIRLDKEAYGFPEEEHDDFKPSVLGDSLLEPLTSEAAAASLAPQADPAAAGAEYQEIKDYVSKLRKKFQEATITEEQSSIAVDRLSRELMELSHGATMIQAALNAKKKKKEAALRDLQRKREDREREVRDRARQLADHNQRSNYKRHITEAVLREEIATIKIEKSNERLASERESLENEVEESEFRILELLAELNLAEREEEVGY